MTTSGGDGRDGRDDDRGGGSEDLATPVTRAGGARRRAWREVRAIAGQEALDGVRARRQLAVRTITPVVLFVCVMGVTFALRGEDTRTHPGRYEIAVEGDFAGARTTLAALATDRLHFFAAPDARLATIDDADAGMAVPDDLDGRLATAGDRDPPITVYEITVDPPSRAAAVILQSGLVNLHASTVKADLDQARAGPSAGAAGAAAGSFTIDKTNVERTVTGTRTLTSQVIPGLLCLQAALLVAGTANRLVSRRTSGLLTAQLLLPVSRRSLAIAKGLGEVVVGLVTATPVVAAVLGFGLIVALRDGSAAGSLVQTVATALTLVALFVFTTTVGVLIGTAARTQEQVSLATGGAVVVAALVATTVALGTFEPPPAMAAIPFAGVVGTLRQTLNGNGSPLAFAGAVVSTLLGALAVSALGGRSLDAERLVMRNG